MIWLILVTYIIGVFALPIWEACIGFNVNWDDRDAPHIVVASFFWMIALPVIWLISFIKWFEKTKDKRISKERLQRQLREELDREKEKSRYQAEREFIKINAELEKELIFNQLMGGSNDSKKKNNA